MQTLHKLFRKVKFDKNHFKVFTQKKQLVFHHTGGSTADGAINWWKIRLDGKGSVSAPIVIEPDGTAILLYNIFYHSDHLGVKNNYNLNKIGIPLELVCEGFLTEAQANKLKPSEVQEYETPFRGFKWFKKYTNAQIDTLSQLAPTICHLADIPINPYKYSNYFEINKDALTGKPGMFSHAAYHPGKTDLHPQPEMISLLSSF